jgi:AcrR family transcriptional regulator
MTPGRGTAADPAPPRRSRARRGEGDRLREEILAAAERLLIETNDEGALSIRAIAAAVGVTPPSIYLHFADRNDLLFAVIERHSVQLETAVNGAAEGVADPIERLHRRGRAYLRYGTDHPEHYRILMMSRPDITPTRFIDERMVDTAALSPVVDDLREAMDAGLIPEQDPLRVAMILWMMMHGIVSLLISKPDFPFPDPEESFETAYQLLLAGLVQPPGRR